MERKILNNQNLLLGLIIFLAILVSGPKSVLAQEPEFPSSWNTSAPSRLQLGISTTVAEDVITYALYPKAVDQQRMLDLRINVPLPVGVTFLSAEAPPTFTSSFDGREVSYFTLELAQQAEIEPLLFKVSTQGLVDSLVVTHVWASWKNAGGEVGVTIPAKEQIASDKLIVMQPQIPQRVIFDPAGDVPRAEYDLTSIAFQENGATLVIIFNLAENVGAVGQPWQYTLFIDGDCSSNTGELRQNRGAEYRVNYNLETGRATITPWDTAAQDWRWEEAARLDALVEGKSIGLALPYHLISLNQQFCWVVQTRPIAEALPADLPSDWLPNETFVALTRHEIGSVAPNPIRGKVAIPLNNARGFYDVSVFALLAGRELVRIPNARQPNFRFDGQKLLTNHESVAAENFYEQGVTDSRTVRYVLKNYSAIENIHEYDFMTGLEQQVSDGSLDAFPFYSPGGEQIVYQNAADLAQPSHLFVQCSLLPPRQAGEGPCQDLSDLGLLVLHTAADTLTTSHPVWTGGDMIAYQACSGSACGIYLVDAAASRGTSDGAVPMQLTQHATDLPADAKFNMLTFTSQRDGNWEAYLINVDGTGLQNLSNSSNSQDGLPAISPDGQWVAFVSDRAGSWAVWAAPVAGGPVQKLFDLPTDTPWGAGDRAWTNERISWGP
ncbi:MAG: PD40 domain-containing protein [Anaerolineae bacterium]|nr:PD40 domain-containing protein [Anaerolineae bacterium]